MLGRWTVLGGRYTLAERIGSGAMGEVWRAEDGVLEREVAVKILRPGLLDDDTFALRFRREARVLATLNHPNIVNVHDYGEVESDAEAESGLTIAYIVMELIDGTPLDDVLRERGPLPPDEALTIAAKALDGLHAAHERQIVHRDIKPSNLMLRADGRVTVTDFGIAHAPDSPKLTAEHAVVGTANYMAPEQAQGRTVPASDLYSIGAVCYFLLTGEPPFSGGSAIEVLLKHVRDPAPVLPDAFPEPVRVFVARALAKSPDDRYENAAVMAAMARVAADEAAPRPVATPPATPPKGNAEPGDAPSGRPDRKRRRLPLVLILPLVIVVSTVTVVYVYPGIGGPGTDAPGMAAPTGAVAGAEGPGAERPDSVSPGPSESESEGEADPASSPSPDEESQAADGGGGGTGNRQQGGEDSAGGGQSGSSGDTGETGDSGSGGNGGGGADDPAPVDPDPDPDSTVPEGCGGDGWGHITNVGNGLRIGLASDSPEDGAAVVMGGSTAYGWIHEYSAFDRIYPCNMNGPPLSQTGLGEQRAVISYGWGAEVDEWVIVSGPSGAYYIKNYGGTTCLTSNGQGAQLTLTTCTSGNESQLWRVPEGWA
ncbi:serine/threonine-protein kinase [Streptomyces sp. 8K308]|uniref:serine/threonine protein kinase n=1 Tax=Streptomyces sp. 8K308 TaxID=2530388 RepID=UPI0014050393|nr:serine/threonine-protein kinase [Streptomyces sp. 8K308]